MGINVNLILGAHPCLSDPHNITDVISMPKSARFILTYSIRLAFNSTETVKPLGAITVFLLDLLYAVAGRSTRNRSGFFGR